ncbi:MAG: TRAP transporter substrate-binding protein [Deltaproteobacteria bacterium]|nr:TRAP transporter substrate-binding protein [Deltaproteobacteria bacterium]
MKKRYLMLTACFILFTAMIIIPFSTAQAKKAKPIVLSFNHLFPDVVWFNTKVVIPWTKMVEEKTNGRVKINIYPSAALAKPGSMYDAVKAGTVDICFDAGPYYMGRHLMSEATQLPFLGAHSSRAASRAWMDLYNEFPELKKEYSDVHLLWLASQGPGQLISRKPVKKMEDMKGLIVRAPGGIGEIVKALGGSPVSMPAPHCYIALSKGTVEGTIFPGEAITTWKLHEVTKYITVGDFYVQWFWTVMNQKKFNSLPKDIQKIIDECSGAAGADLHGKEWDAADKAGFEFAKQKGMEFINLSPEEMARWERACAPITERWITRMAGKGYPAKRFLNEARRLINKYNKEFGSWRD